MELRLTDALGGCSLKWRYTFSTTTTDPSTIMDGRIGIGPGRGALAGALIDCRHRACDHWITLDGQADDVVKRIGGRRGVRLCASPERDNENYEYDSSNPWFHSKPRACSRRNSDVGEDPKSRRCVLGKSWGTEPIKGKVSPRTGGVIQDTGPCEMNDAKCFSLGERQFLELAFSRVGFRLAVRRAW